MGLSFVAASALSSPAMADNNMALSVTFRVMGPGVSNVLEIGTIPLRLSKPVVGFNPTTEFELDGERIEPEVSEPTAATA